MTKTACPCDNPPTATLTIPAEVREDKGGSHRVSHADSLLSVNFLPPAGRPTPALRGGKQGRNRVAARRNPVPDATGHRVGSLGLDPGSRSSVEVVRGRRVGFEPGRIERQLRLRRRARRVDGGRHAGLSPRTRVPARRGNA